MLPPVRISKRRKPKPILPEPNKPKFSQVQTGEILSGKVNGIKASAAEERGAKSLYRNKAVDSFEFRRAINAPRNMPGFKELDFLVSSKGIAYAFEVDSPFTHILKQRADVLHDAIVLKSLEQDGFMIYPKVFHIAGETDLADQTKADNYFKEFFQ